MARCWLDGTELNAWLVAEGWAVAYRRYSTLYVDEERSAELKGKGIWSGTFEKPKDWRNDQPSSQQASAQKDGCEIKGNISRRGERIYHDPGGEYYEQTRIDESKGERWFCSEREAKDAGWRKSKR